MNALLVSFVLLSANPVIPINEGEPAPYEGILVDEAYVVEAEKCLVRLPKAEAKLKVERNTQSDIEKNLDRIIAQKDLVIQKQSDELNSFWHMYSFEIGLAIGIVGSAVVVVGVTQLVR